MKIIKSTFVIIGLVAINANAFTATAQEVEEENVSVNSNYNTRNLYMHVSYGIGGGDWATRGAGIGLLAKATPRLYTGISAYYYGDAGGRANIQQMIPVSAMVQYEMVRTKSGNGAIVLGTSVGYNFVLNREYFNERFSKDGRINNGLYLNPSIGYRLNFTKNTGIVLDLGYQLVQGKGVEIESKDLLQNHVQHNILLKGSIFF